MRTHAQRDPEELEGHLVGLIEASREQASEDPFRNPVLAVTLAITRRFDRDEIGEADLDALFVRLRAQACPTARRGCAPMSGSSTIPMPTRRCRRASSRRCRTGRTRSSASATGSAAPRFAVVFTAHPTFGMPKAVAGLLAAGREPRRPERAARP